MHSTAFNANKKKKKIDEELSRNKNIMLPQLRSQAVCYDKILPQRPEYKLCST